MQLVSTDEETRKRFFAKLMRCHTKVMNTTAGAHDTRGASAAVTAAGALAAALDSASHAASPGEASSADAPLPVLTEAVTAPLESFDFSDLSAAPTANAPTPAAAASAVPFDEDTEPAAAPPEFAAVTIQNPFGDGDIEVEEISMPDLPTPGGPSGAADSASGGDEHSRLVKGLKEGVWIEFRDDDDNRRPARLSYISPLKGTYLFVNRQGKKVGEYSVYQLAREFRSGRASLLDAVPLFDRAMGSLVGALRATAAPA
jgi:hypothetical protein